MSFPVNRVSRHATSNICGPLLRHGQKLQSRVSPLHFWLRIRNLSWQSCKRHLHESQPRYHQLCKHRLHNCLGITTSLSSTNSTGPPSPLVCGEGGGARLVTKCAGTSDRGGVARQAGEGSHKLQGNTAPSAVRSCSRHHQGPVFDFLALRDDVSERAVEEGLIGHMEKF